jgi:hypothetical protein
MIDLERCFGYNSTFYLLNGRSGRFGARSGIGIIPELRTTIPDGWGLGMHYNYDTFLSSEPFIAQKRQLEEAVKSPVVAGRAHYLRFNPFESFSFLETHHIRVDESSGYPDRIGYRNGIAGCFQPFNVETKTIHRIWEIPMTIMDAVIVNQYGGDAVARCGQMIHHLSRVGGAMSIVFHPGQFFNPEHQRLLGVYHKILIECRHAGTVSATGLSLIDSID